MIRGISGQLPERWKLKIGGRGTERQKRDGTGPYRLPEKWDHMKICRIERDENGDFIVDGELTKALGDSEKPKLLGPVVFLYNDPDLNLWTAYRAYKGRTCMCRGDGESAERLDEASGERKKIACPCPMLEQGRCKPNGILSFVIPEGTIGGVCKFRTTSWNSIRTLLGGMALIRQITGGVLRGIPVYLRMNEKAVDVKGKPQTVYFLSVEFKGNLKDIRKTALDSASEDAKQLVLVENVEAKARKQLALEMEIEEADDEEALEFYSTVERRDDGTVVDKRSGEIIEMPTPAGSDPLLDGLQSNAIDADTEEAPGEGAEEGGDVPQEDTVSSSAAATESPPEPRGTTQEQIRRAGAATADEINARMDYLFPSPGDAIEPEEPETTLSGPISKAEAAIVRKRALESGWKAAEVTKYLKTYWQISKSTEITYDIYGSVLEDLEDPDGIKERRGGE